MFAGNDIVYTKKSEYNMQTSIRKIRYFTINRIIIYKKSKGGCLHLQIFKRAIVNPGLGIKCLQEYFQV